MVVVVVVVAVAGHLSFSSTQFEIKAYASGLYTDTFREGGSLITSRSHPKPETPGGAALPWGHHRSASPGLSVKESYMTWFCNAVSLLKGLQVEL